MISLKVRDYCGSCPRFTPKTETIEHSDYYSGITYDTFVFCENEDLCSELLAHIKSEVSKKNEMR